ncbi:hypothetical protein R2571_005744 [Pseudomonas aeruginosa]|nr:hypothetical protein [Pseudomonas aeruginosa]
MPYYDVGCYECGTRMSVFLPYEGLDEVQLSLINKGQPFPVLKENICSETSLDQEQTTIWSSRGKRPTTKTTAWCAIRAAAIPRS